jgi:fused signal recognition particle receptor
MGIISSAIDTLKDGLSKTRDMLSSGFQKLLSMHREIDEDFLDELEEMLITADIGVETSMELIDDLREAYKNKEIEELEEVRPFLENKLTELLDRGDEHKIQWNEDGPTVFLIVGVNGSGKTTTIAKLAASMKDDGYTSILAAADTFRAGAAEQLETWADRIDTEIVKHESGGDAGAVVYDATEAAKSRDRDCVFVDTAGRLHTEKNLMKELEKIQRVVGDQIEGAPHETLLVLDATIGQNAIQQAQKFNEATELSGIVMAKLDGTAKGGALIPIQRELDVPVKFIGLGEQAEDIEPFEPRKFVEALLE